MLVPMNLYNASSSDDPLPPFSTHSHHGKPTPLLLVFKVGVALVVVCIVVSILAVATAAVFQARAGSIYLRVSDQCPNASAAVLDEASDTYGILIKARFASHLSEFCAACLVIVLYVAVGLMGYSIVSSARKKIEASLAKLRQVQASIGSQHEAQAAVAGAARNAKQLRLCAAGRC
jgi:hypothetical protein